MNSCSFPLIPMANVQLWKFPEFCKPGNTIITTSSIKLLINVLMWCSPTVLTNLMLWRLKQDQQIQQANLNDKETLQTWHLCVHIYYCTLSTSKSCMGKKWFPLENIRPVECPLARSKCISAPQSATITTDEKLLLSEIPVKKIGCERNDFPLQWWNMKRPQIWNGDGFVE